MKKLYLLLFLIISFTSFSQKLSYTLNDFGSIGDEYPLLKHNYHADSMPVFSEVAPYGWNFSSLIPTELDTTKIVSPDSIGDFPSLPEGSMALKDGSGSVEFIKLYDDTLMIVGIYVGNEEGTIPVIFPEPMPLIKFPLTIGESTLKNSIFDIYGTPESFGISATGVDSMRFHIKNKYNSMVEDTGMLVTNQNSYKTFKVRLENTFHLDVYIKVPGAGWMLYQEDMVADSTSSYQFFNPEYKLPLCYINMTWDEHITSFRIIDNSHLGIFSSKQTTENNVYPNPVKANETIYFKNSLINIDIYNMEGKLVKTAKNTSSISLYNIKSGVYIIKGNSSSKTFTEKIIVK